MIYRVSGTDRITRETREVYIDAQSAVEANECAWSRGIAGPKEEQIRPEDVPPGAPVLRPDSSGRTITPVRPELSDLMTRPVWTIAKGVLLGSLMFAGIIFLIQLILVLLGMTLMGLFL